MEERRKLPARDWSLTEAAAMANAAEMAERRSAEKVSSFSVTCSRLSRYLREKGSLGDLRLSLSVMPGDRTGAAKPETPRTMNLMPGVEIFHENDEPETRIASSDKKSDEISKEEKKGQMTIFYGGKVVVFDDFPAEKAKELMIMAKRSCPAPAPSLRVESPAPVLPQPSTSEPATAPAPRSSQKPSPAPASDLPIARRVSLNRFLEKRKDRITSKAPYPASGKGEDGEKWLGLAAPPPPSGQLRLNG